MPSATSQHGDPNGSAAHAPQPSASHPHGQTGCGCPAHQPANNGQPVGSLIASSPRAFRSPAAWVTLLLVLTAGLTLDLASKAWAFQTVAGSPVHLDRAQVLADPNYHPIPPHAGIRAIGWGLLDFQLVINRGAVFGLGPDRRMFFIAFTLGALIAGLYVFGRMTKASHRMAHMALGLILAGGLGNLYDRIVFGVVRDFLHMLPEYRLPFGWHWPANFGGSPEVFPWVFNVADVMLLVGMGLLMIHIHRVESQRKRLEEQMAAAEKPATSAPSPH